MHCPYRPEDLHAFNEEILPNSTSTGSTQLSERASLLSMSLPRHVSGTSNPSPTASESPQNLRTQCYRCSMCMHACLSLCLFCIRPQCPYQHMYLASLTISDLTTFSSHLFPSRWPSNSCSADHMIICIASPTPSQAPGQDHFAQKDSIRRDHAAMGKSMPLLARYHGRETSESMWFPG